MSDILTVKSLAKAGDENLSRHTGEILAVLTQQVQHHQTCACSECFPPASFALIPKGTADDQPNVAL